MTPRLHLVTDAETLRAAGFADRARAVLAAHGASVALHSRGHGLDGRRLYEITDALADAARDSGALLVVNDRIDIALALSAAAVQLGRRSLPLPAARRLLPGADIGWSAHDAAEAVAGVAGGADWVILGGVWPTASHPARPAIGLQELRAAASTCGAPVLAIGGVTPERVGAALGAGAHGVAVLSGVWRAADAAAAARRYLEELERGSGGGGAT